MIQAQTKILIKDNSDLLEGTCINSYQKTTKKAAKVGNCVKASIKKVKSNFAHRNTSGKSTNTGAVGKKRLNDLLIIQTKRSISRKDGSTIQFSKNCGVSIIFKKSGSKKQHLLGFKRISTTVPFELKNKMYGQRFKAAYNIIKVAKNLI